MKSTISDAEVEAKLIEKPTLLKIPNYQKPIEFGLIYKIAYKVEKSSEKKKKFIFVKFKNLR